MDTQRDNLRAGAFVLAGIILTISIVFVLSDFEQLFALRQDVKVYFTLREGLQGLKKGATVTIGDQPVGQVTDISDVVEDDRLIGKMVIANIPGSSTYQLYWDAKIELVVPTIGGTTTLNIRSIGTKYAYDPNGAMPKEVAPEGVTPPVGAIAGGLASSTLGRSFGIDDTQRDQITRIIANLARLSKALADSEAKGEVPIERMIIDLEAMTKSAKEAVANANAMIDDARGGIADIRKGVGEVRTAVTDVQHTVKDVRTVMADVKQRSPAWFDEIDKTTVASRESVTMVKDLLKNNGSRVTKTIDNAEKITTAIREKNLVQITGVLDKANTSLENLKHASVEMRSLMTSQSPVMARALANFSLTADQLKLASIEVRRSPWRLLYSPGDEELETDNLYDAARSFALAAGTLDTAAQSLQSVVDQTPDDDARIKSMVQRLETLFEKFEGAESDFWEALRRQKPPR